MPCRILIADDHQMFREALRLLFERQPGLEVVAETGDGLAVLPLVDDAGPDIVCLDIGMPGLGGIAIAGQIAARHPKVGVIGLSTYCDRSYVTAMLAAGAKGYVTKAAAGDELLRAIDTVTRGRTYLCPDAADSVRAAVANADEARPDALAKLGPREIQVLRLVALGHTSAQVAAQLGIAPSTVEVHRRNIMRKLGLDNAVAMARYAIRCGLVSSD